MTRGANHIGFPLNRPAVPLRLAVLRMANYSSDVWSRWGPWALAVSWQLFFLRGKLRYEIVRKTSKTLKFRQDEFFFVLL